MSSDTMVLFWFKILEKKAFLDGLTEGRKEGFNLGKESKISLIKFQVEQKVLKFEKENAELKAQIEKMKDCRNCKYYGNYKDDFMCVLVGQKIHCKNKDKWELEE